MCILFFITDKTLSFGRYKLILASNRDEFYARPAAVAQRWESNPNTIGGYDMETGKEFGTWLAVNVNSPQKTIKVGALLNVTGEKLQPDAKARGPIVADYVNGTLDNLTYTNQLLATGHFNVFNFITIEMSNDKTQILYASNAPQTTIDLPKGECIGIGNSPFKTPFRKVSAGKALFDEVINDGTLANKEQLIEKLMGLLKCDVEHWPDNELATRQPQWGQSLSHINVRMKGYGTRTHTVILVDELNNVDFIEVTMATPDPNGEWVTTRLQSQL